MRRKANWIDTSALISSGQSNAIYQFKSKQNRLHWLFPISFFAIKKFQNNNGFHCIPCNSRLIHSEQTCTSLNLYWIHIQSYFNVDQKISVCIRLYDSDDGNVWDMDLCMNEEADASCFFQFFTRHWSHLVFMCTDKCMCVSDFSSFKLKLMWQINLISKKKSTEIQTN